MKQPQRILVFGATSAIVYETLKHLAAGGAHLYLCARRTADLERLSADLTIRGAADIHVAEFDAASPPTIAAAIDDCLHKFPDLDGLLVGHGILPDQQQCEADFEAMRAAFEINFLSVAEILTRISNHFESRRRGTIVVISSVAGDRGRASNYVYGASKSALDAFLSGLRQRLFRAGVRVITVKPGFVDTPMTREFDKNLLWASPAQVGKQIYAAMAAKNGLLYTPGFWRGIMTAVRMMPEGLFKRFRL